MNGLIVPLVALVLFWYCGFFGFLALFFFAKWINTTLDPYFPSYKYPQLYVIPEKSSRERLQGYIFIFASRKASQLLLKDTSCTDTIHRVLPFRMKVAMWLMLTAQLLLFIALPYGLYFAR